MKAGWVTKSLGDVCQVIGGGTPPKDRADYYSGDIHWATVRDMRSDLITVTEFKITEEAIKSSATNIIPGGNVVIATRVGLGKVCLLGQDTAINQDLRGIVPIDPRALSVKYLYWWLKSIVDLIVAEGTGATVQGVKLPFVKSLKIPVPPLPEQKRIVAILDEAFDGIATARANTEKNLKNTDALFECCFDNLFDKDDKEGDIKFIGDFCDLFQGMCINAKTKHLIVDGGGVPLLRIKDLRANSAEIFVAEKGCPNSSYVTESEIIYTRTGQVGLVFRGRNGVLHNNCFKVIPRGGVRGDYLFWLLQAPAFRRRITSLSSKTAQPDITHAIFKSQKVVIPPDAHQIGAIEKIEGLNSEARRLRSLYLQKLNALGVLEKAILHQAFSGQL